MANAGEGETIAAAGSGTRKIGFDALGNGRSGTGSTMLQLHNSDHPVMNLISTHLDGKNYLAWSRAVQRALCAKSKLRFITGTCVKLIGDPKLVEQWIRAHSMVTFGCLM
ncbi:UNVERIFIED_CONTAM: hypothetical protein Sradi_1890500 [Sesamum radiatum]|uniref:Retrotransposon Copia-like N-terminal domain-containing protein n=1 Tax=Sesamum radiatum TaxID=300843 RepID=A0AAW2U169_SESRA